MISRFFPSIRVNGRTCPGRAVLHLIAHHLRSGWLHLALHYSFSVAADALIQSPPSLRRTVPPPPSIRTVISCTDFIVGHSFVGRQSYAGYGAWSISFSFLLPPSFVQLSAHPTAGGEAESQVPASLVRSFGVRQLFLDRLDRSSHGLSSNRWLSR